MAFDEKTVMFPETEMVPSSSGGAVESKIPEPPAKLSVREKKVWTHITQALKEYQLVHLTDGIVLTIIVKTFIEWLDAEKELADYKKKNKGSYITRTPNGYEQPHQLYYVTRDKKRELLQWLPEAALTIPSFMKTKSRQMIDSRQQDMFTDPVVKYLATRPDSYNAKLQ